MDDKYAGDRSAIDARTDSNASLDGYERYLAALPPDDWKALLAAASAKAVLKRLETAKPK